MEGTHIPGKNLGAEQERESPRDLQAEPSYPGLNTVVFSLRFPNSSMTAHGETERCRISYPHYTKECREWND